MKTTDTHGAQNDDDYEDNAVQTLLQQVKRRGRLCACCKCCFRSDHHEDDDIDADMSMIDVNNMTDDIPKPGVPKKRVVLPNSNQDKWLQYLLSNLNEMTDIDWVADLLPRIENDQDEYNAGKYRGAIF